MSSDAGPTLTIASSNVHWGRGLRWKGFPPYDVVAACTELDADVLALQESWAPDDGVAQHDLVARALGMHVVAHPLARVTAGPKPQIVRALGPDDDPTAAPGTGTWGIALLSRQPFRSTRVVRLPQLRLDPTSRAVLLAEIEVEGVPLTVATTHLPHLQMGSPLITGALRRALPPASERALLIGDMNMWSPCIAAMAPRGWRRRGRGRTFPSPYPHSRIDHLLVTPSVEVCWSEVVRDTRSDHRPIRAGLRLR